LLNDGVIQQVGSPMELYDNPANRFVADFLGTANLIDGRVEKGQDKITFQADDGTLIPLNGTGVEAGPGTAMFRPQDLTIRNPGEDADDGAVLPGRVQHREFLGSLIRYAIRVGDNVILVDDSHQAGRPVFDVGDDVALRLAVDQVRILAG
jgi:iron(III) transport system ATP-binding protein